MERFDVAVVGAGLLGCFAARSLSALSLRTVVLEAREDVCTGLSSANTGIVYSGCDTKPDTLKSRLCVRNSIAFPALCRELDVPYSPCGSLMVCTQAGEERVRRKYAQGLRNGAPGLALLSGAEAREQEPGLSDAFTLALYSPTTGTVDPWALGIAAFENARENGVDFRFRAPVRQMERREGGFVLETDASAFFARCVINCAGLNAHVLRELVEAPRVRIFPNGADYLILDHDALPRPRHVIFHETDTGKGVTLVPTVDGSVLIGPADYPAEDVPRRSRAQVLRELPALARQVMPSLPVDAAIRSFAARRPNAAFVRPGPGGWEREERDISGFTVWEEQGLISLLGIKTPGLTCAQGLGQYAAELAVAFLGGAEKNADYSPTRRGIPRVRSLSETERTALIAAGSDYGRVLCRCRDITLGEVREAIRRGAVSVDGVKRRCGSGMGRCQGSRCRQAILEELSRAQGCAVTAIQQDGEGSFVVVGEEHGTL